MNLCGAPIGSIMISGHAPVSIFLHALSYDAWSWTWLLNKKILDDAVALTQVSDTIPLYFAKNLMSEARTGSVWKGHKAVV